MIEIEYLLERDEGNKIEKYKPKYYGPQIPEISCIKGPNGSGKSIILNIIALGFYGQYLEENELNPELRSKILSLMNTEHQRLKFSIKVDNEKMDCPLIAEKPFFDKANIIVSKIINGTKKPILPENFRKEYKVIYDLPKNPLNRLPELITEIQNEQKSIGFKIQSVRQEVEGIITEVKKSNNASLVGELKRKQTIEQEKNIKIKNEKAEKESLIIDLTHLFVCSNYLNNVELLDRRKNEYSFINKRKGAKKKQERRLEEREKQLRIKYLSACEKAKNIRDTKLLSNTSFVAPEDMKRFNIWGHYVIHDSLLDEHLYKQLKDDTDYLLGKLIERQNIELKVSAPILERNDFFSSLVKVLNDFKNSSIKIPLINTSINEFMDMLIKEIRLDEDVVLKLENIKNIIDAFSTFQGIIADGNKIVKEAGGIVEEDEDEEISVDDKKIQALSKEISEIEKKLESIRSELVKINVPEKKAEIHLLALKENPKLINYYHLSDTQLQATIASIANRIDLLQEQILSSDHKIQQNEFKIQEYQSQAIHKYNDYLPNLEKLAETLRLLEQKLLRIFESNLKKIKSSSSYEGLTAAEKNYAICVNNFLARKIPKLQHIEATYNVRTIDLIKKHVETDSNPSKIILFDDIGTGQSQSAFLTGLLNNSDNKKVIALFDEVAMMDEKSLKPIKDRLLELKEEGKLVLGLIVQKDEEVSVECIK